MRFLISILSDQLTPNVLFLKQIGKEGNKHIFISTNQMEEKQKSSILADTLGLKVDDFEILVIDANRPLRILESLNAFHWSPSGTYIVNITGGTKMMSQTVFLFFTQQFHHREATEVFYWPIGESVMEQLHPTIREIIIDRPYQLDLKTYIRAHGFNYISQNQLSHPFAKSDELFNKIVHHKSAEHVPEIMNAKDENYLQPDKGYFLGGWFEEWLYYFLKSELNLPDSQITFNLKLKSRQSIRKTESDNEIDVAFVYNNKFYVWECKVYYRKRASGSQITKDIYKISSICQNLGLQAISLVAILAPFGNNKLRHDFLEDITRLMRVKRVFSLEDMKNRERFIEYVRQMVS